MQETISLIMDYVRSAWRFRWLALAAAWLVCIVGWSFVALQKDRFAAEARVYVDTDSELRRILPEQLVETNITEQLRFMRESMLGTVQLERLARASDLDLETQSPEELAMVVEDLRGGIQITMGSPTTERRGRTQPEAAGNVYTISYQHPDPAKATEVVGDLLDIFMEDMVGAQQSTSDSTGQFLRKQIADYEARLRSAEDKIAEFNQRHYDRLPGLQGGYFTRLQTETTALTTAREQLNLAESRLASINQQLRGEATQLSSGSESTLTEAIDTRIRDTEAGLEELQLRYTDQHPDVIAARENLDQLRARREEQLQSIARGEVTASSNSPVFQALQISKNEVEAEVATLRADVSARATRIEELRGLIDEMPGVEAERAQLTRDYDVINAQYQSMLESLERERLTREAQQSESVEFRIIDPPAASPTPVYPPRALFMLGVLFAGLGAGAAVALLMSLLKPVFNSATSLINATGVQVLGTVGRYAQAIDRKAQRASILMFSAGCVSLMVTFAGVVAFEMLGGGVRSLL